MDDAERQRLYQEALRGRALKQQSMQQVERNADEEWKAAALESVKFIRLVYPDFTTDEVWLYLRHVYPEADTHEPRALGPIMAKAARMGLIRKKNEHRNSGRSEAHANPKQVWEAHDA